MNCAQCGKEIPADSEFCGYCGAAAVPSAAAGAQQAAEATSAAQPPPPPPPPPPAPPSGGPPPPPAQAGAGPPAGAGVPPGQYGQPAKKSPLPWILGILAVAAIVAIVLILVFVVFKGDDNGGGEAGANPEQTVEAFFEALERQDAGMLIATMEPDFAAEIKDILGDEYLMLLDEYFFTWFPKDLEITITKMDTTIDGDTAEVTVEEGTMSYTEDGERVTEDAADADMDAFELVKVDGKWYLSEDFLIDMGFDFSGYEDMNLDNLDTELDDGYYDDMGVELPIDSEDEALTVVFEDADIWDWYMETDGAYFDVTDENTSYVVYLYEIDEDYNEIPYGYFAVDKETGEMYELVD